MWDRLTSGLAFKYYVPFVLGRMILSFFGLITLIAADTLVIRRRIRPDVVNPPAPAG
jgi:hypothetical protein